MKIRQTKAISAVIATIMLLMTTVSLVGVFYVFSSTLATTTTSSGSEQASQLTSQLSMCMQIVNIAGNQITLRNCGEGVIDNNSLVAMLDNIKAVISADTIQENSAGTVNVTIPGAWNMSQTNPSKKYSLVISNGAATAQALVELTQRKSNLAGSWNFEEGAGITAADTSGSGNTGTLKNLTAATCFVNGACPDWADGKFGKGLQFDGVGDYVNLPYNFNFQTIHGPSTLELWFKPSVLSGTKNIFSDSCLEWGIYHSGSTIYGRAYSAVSGGSIQTGQWYHALVMHEHPTGLANTVIKFYINGEFKEQATLTITQNGYTDTPYGIGSDTNTACGPNSDFNGTIDEVRVWNRALAPDQTVGMKQII